MSEVNLHIVKKQFTKILGANIVSNQAEGVISLVSGIHIDPENGKVIALQCGFKKVLMPLDILKWNRNIHVNDHSALTTREHILRLQNISKARENIMYKLVYTDNGEHIGRVHDFTIDTKALMLVSLTVKKKFLWMTMFETMIPYKNIIEIQDTQIIVKDIHSTKRIPVARTETI